MIWRNGSRFLSNSAMDFLNCPSKSCLCNEAGPYKDPAIFGEVNPTISCHDPIVWIMKPCMIILYLENINLNSTSFITSNEHQTVSVLLTVNQLIFGSFTTNDFFVEINPASELLPWKCFPFWGGMSPKIESTTISTSDVATFGGMVNFFYKTLHYHKGHPWKMTIDLHGLIVWSPQKNGSHLMTPSSTLGYFFKKPSFHDRFAKLHDRICHFDLQVTVEPGMWCITSSLRLLGYCCWWIKKEPAPPGMR